MKRVLVCAVVLFSVLWLVSESAAQQKTPVRGGILREIWSSGPRVFSYLPEMGPGDEQAILPASEKLMEYREDHQLVPFLAQSVDVAKDGKSITFKLKKGIKFTDGSDLNAEAVAWNYQLNIDAKRLQYRDKITKIEIVDPYTLKFHITDFNNQLLHSYGWVPIFSKAAWDKAGGGNADKSKKSGRARISCAPAHSGSRSTSATTS